MSHQRAPLTSAAACTEYIQQQDPAIIAERIREDQQLCHQGRLPSILAYHLPHPSSTIGKRIIGKLFPELHFPGTEGLKAFRYQGILDAIKAYLAQMEQNQQILDDESEEESQGDAPGSSSTSDIRHKKSNGNIPVEDQNATALSTLRQLRAEGVLIDDMSLWEVIKKLEKLCPDRAQDRRLTAKRCYICRFIASNPHPLYPSMCEPCGAFNLAELSISLPERLNLRGKAAVVIGGRVNLGFHTALRLLRCGAFVIVTTRYPHDAEARCLKEQDSELWNSRLGIIGADFRRAADVFALIMNIKKVLNDWRGSNGGTNSNNHLDILINNAAQTLRLDSC